MTAYDQTALHEIEQRTRSQNIGFITSHRSDCTTDENLRRRRALQADISSGDFGFRHIDSSFMDSLGQDQPKPVIDRAYMVIGKEGDDSGRLKGFLKTLAANYQQEFVAWKAHDATDVLLARIILREEPRPAVEEVSSLGNFRPANAGDYHAALLREKGLMFESGGLVEMAGIGFFGSYGRYLRAKQIYDAQFRDTTT
ncbi:hypothetical protein [Burkholderia sp. Ac-20353]|uniref:hypothetical protein n=1 Tax=Burkholderia sp. Ac-20353 TaxID=2703894 RepID=UPI00197C18A2|nr:hypothetical protein [Burkholderia sp. Ac-20353]MBN3791434.1 hypothetical protein [Burkholderia sp. Ac-20353]